MAGVDRNLQNRYSRRAALQKAALGAGALAVGAYARPAWAGGVGPDGSIDAYEGLLLGKGTSSLIVERYGQPITTQVTPAATLWKGEATSLSSFLEGDSVLVRTVAGQLTNAWANLDKVRGAVAGENPTGYEVVDDRTGQTVEVVIQGSTKTQDVFGQASALPSNAPTGTWFDAAGLAVEGAIIGSVVRFALPGVRSRAAHIEPPKMRELASFEYRQMATWFSCPTGAGRCGTCNTSNSSQCAWPALDTCGCCSTTCCDCAKNCFTQAYLSCGTNVVVTDPCTNAGNTCAIVDCGPCNNQSCHTRCSTVTCGHTCTECGGQRTTPIVDLTKPSFAIFRDPSQFGCILANVTG